MIAYTLIGPQRCQCGAVVFHVAHCPMCGGRTDIYAKSFDPPPYKPPPEQSKKGRPGRPTLPREPMSNAAIASSEKNRLRWEKWRAENPRTDRQPKKDRWAQDYLEKNKGAL